MIGDSLRGDILQANIDMLREMKIEPTALENGYVPVDIDVTVPDNSKTKKEGVSRTYKEFNSYAPIMAYIGTEGYFVNTQFRVGKQHCQKETLDFLRETIELCRQLTDKSSNRIFCTISVVIIWCLLKKSIDSIWKRKRISDGSKFSGNY